MTGRHARDARVRPANGAAGHPRAPVHRDPSAAAARGASQARAHRESPRRHPAPWREELDALNARVAVQDMALRALVQSHPRPADVLEAWQQLRADKVVAAYAPKADTPTRAWLTSAAHALAEDWTSELSDVASRRAETHASSSDADDDVQG